MKTFKKILVISLIITASFTFAASSKAGEEADFTKSNAWNKVGSSLQELWQSAQKSGRLNQKVECFLVTSSPVAAEDRDLLFGIGYYAQVVTGSIARGHMNLSDLPKVAESQLVRKIKLAK
jgi:hypothetical protein